MPLARRKGVCMDPNNPVVKLLVEGMGAESQGRGVDARVLFERAWADRPGGR